MREYAISSYDVLAITAAIDKSGGGFLCVLLTLPETGNILILTPFPMIRYNKYIIRDTGIFLNSRL